MNHADIRRLFPAEAKDWPAGEAWLVAVADALPRWVAEERTAEAGLVEALSILMVRLHGIGETERAQTLLPTLEGFAQGRSYHLLWVADVARLLGEADKADAIERALFDSDRLAHARLVDVLERIRDSDGAEAALKAGAARARWTRYPAMLEGLAAIATAAGNEAEATRWAAAAAASKAAAEELKRVEEAERAR